MDYGTGIATGMAMQMASNNTSTMSDEHAKFIVALLLVLGPFIWGFANHYDGHEKLKETLKGVLPRSLLHLIAFPFFGVQLVLGILIADIFKRVKW